ncbi:MAG: septal ring lytic transglycosylase RlpA family protein [Acidobacteriia bacterium]|nr:septal ring lytic transglycosylase RlpA family protein [Terriglobia bacterium]
MLRGAVYAVAVLFLAVVAMMSACARKTSARVAAPARVGSTESGIASWYGAPYHGRATSSGEIYDQEQLTAAHRSLPFNTWVEVTNLENQKRVDVRITDRGPFVDGRIIDLSLAAARDLDMVRSGIARVHLKVIDPPKDAVLPAGDYAVQAGAFSTCERAESVAKKFDDSRVVEGSSVCRVLVGHHLSLDEAKRLAQKVRKTAGEAMVVPDR